MVLFVCIWVRNQNRKNNINVIIHRGYWNDSLRYRNNTNRRNITRLSSQISSTTSPKTKQLAGLITFSTGNAIRQRTVSRFAVNLTASYVCTNPWIPKYDERAMSGSFRVRREFWPSCNVETSPGIRCRRLEWWRTACTAYTRLRLVARRGLATRVQCGRTAAPPADTRLTETLTVAWEIVPLFRFYLSSRHASPRRFSVTRALEMATADGQSRPLFVLHGNAVMMGSMQVFARKMVSRVFWYRRLHRDGVQCSVKRNDSCIYSFGKNELCMNGG